MASEERNLPTSQEKSGQPPTARYDPCFTSPVTFVLGTCLALVGSHGIIQSLKTPGGAPVVLGIAGGCMFFLLGLFLLVIACSPTLRIRLRMGVWPIATPCTLPEIQKLLMATPAPVAVGEGWGFFISKTAPQPSAIALRGQWSGVVTWESDGLLRVRSGTVFGELVRILWSGGRAAVDRPQFDQLSVGAAVRTCGHGWFAEGWFIDAVVALSAVERGTGQLVEVKRSDSRFWMVALGSDYVITEVLLTSMPNRLLRIRQTVERLQRSGGTLAQQLHQNSEWLTSPFKLMFVSASQVIRKWGVYLDAGEGSIDDEVNISGCDLRCRTIRRHLRIPAEYDLVDSVADAHTLIQTIWPAEAVVERLAGTLNVELFVADNFDWEAAIQILAPFHAQHGGRTELRARTLQGKTVTAFDVIMPVGSGILSCGSSNKGFQPWFEMLHSDFGVTSGSVHTGKYIPLSGAPVELVKPVDFWPLVSGFPISVAGVDLKDRVVSKVTRSN